MFEIIIVVFLIVSISKPDFILSKKVKEVANEEQKKEIAKNLRTVIANLLLTVFACDLDLFTGDKLIFLSIILLVTSIVLFFKFSVPAIKRNNEILIELGIKKPKTK